MHTWTLAEFIKYALGAVGIGAFIAFIRLLLGGLYNIENPSYVEYSGDNNERACVYIYGMRSRRQNGYTGYHFIRKNGKWKLDGELKVFINILIGAVVFFIMEIVLVVIADAGIGGIFSALLIDIFLYSFVAAFPLADIILACSAFDDELRKKRNQ